MLRVLIRSEIKEAIILLVFSGLLVETLTTPTIVLVLLGAIMVWFQKRPPRLARNLITLGLFATYWFTYGKVIDPEVGLNFLTSIIVLKLLEKESERDRYMIFFGLMLLISAGSLFQKSLSYVAFFGLSFFILIQDFYKNLKLPTRVIDLIQSLVWVLPFTAFLFFFAPRLLNPFQLEKGAPKEGEIGYTPDVNISQLESLSSNERPVFQARVDSQISSENLYWRGNVLSFSDGWNWPLMPQDRAYESFAKGLRLPENGIKQSIRVFTQQDYFFGLDHPGYFITPKGVAKLNVTKSLNQSRWANHQRYQVLSFGGSFEAPARSSHPSGLKLHEKQWIHQTFRSTRLVELKDEIQKYFQEQKFSYSLSPGKVENLLEFLQEKKTGFCSHYASAVAHILRTKNIPARLVSGFLGGSYNRFAGFYLITQNDAHVWVEAFEDGKWQRIDPTGWIAPDRVRLGGEAFMQEMNAANISPIRMLGSRFGWFRDFQQWFGQWDFRFYQWLEEMDYYGQEALFEKFNLRREYIFSLIPVLLAFFMGLYTWHLTRKRAVRNETEQLWKSFQHKLSKRGVHLSLVSIKEGEQMINKEEEHVRGIWKELLELSFAPNAQVKASELKRKIQSL